MKGQAINGKAERVWGLQVCNHPDLFEGRSITSSFDLWPLQQQYPSAVLQALGHIPWRHVCLGGSGLRFVPHPEALYRWESDSAQACWHQVVQLDFRVHSR